MSNTGDPNLVNHLHNENSYAEAFMADTQTLRRRLVAEMKARMPAKIVTPPESWGDWFASKDMFNYALLKLQFNCNCT